jgi:hypothetical protein
MMQLQPITLPSTLLAPTPVKAVQAEKPSASLLAPQEDDFVRQSNVRVGRDDFGDGFKAGVFTALIGTFVLASIFNSGKQAQLKQLFVQYEKEVRADERKKIHQKALGQKSFNTVVSTVPNNESETNDSIKNIETAIEKTTFSFKPTRNSESFN